MTTDNVSPDAGQPTVGERLRQAREIAGLSVAEVAGKQHLRPAVISAIESGDYRSIDSELFLKGYVRAYATHVGIDPESVVRQLDKELEPLREEQKARVEESPLVNIERRKRRKRRIAKLILVLVVLAAGFYAGSLYLASREAPVGIDAGEDTEAEAPVVEEGTEPDADTMADNLGPGSDADQAEPDEPASSSMPESDPVSSGTGEAPASETIEPDQPVDTTGSDATMTREPGDAVETAQAAGTVPSDPASDRTATAATQSAETAIATSPLAEEEPVAVADTSGQLVVEFSDDCWIEVQDSRGRTLVAELRRAGETLDVNGDGPLRVVLGAVSAVSGLSYGGEPVDLTDRRTRNDRLVLNLSE